MKQHCEKLGVGQFYALFSCMVSGRTWDSIQSGLETTKFTIKEVSVIINIHLACLSIYIIHSLHYLLILGHINKILMQSY